MIISMHKKSFDEQKLILSQALEKLPIGRMAIDETGLGMNLAEDMMKYYPHIIEPVNFAGRVDTDAKKRLDKSNKKLTVAVKERLATLVKIGLERRSISLYRERDLIDQIHSIKREVTPMGNIRYAVEKNEQHHADKFWALALALFVSHSNRPGLLAMPVFSRLNG